MCVAEVFGQKKELDEVAAGWIQHWNTNQAEAMCAFINFVIKCTGCSAEVDVHDIEDSDNAVSKLTDLQDEYQAQKPADYPLVSKAKIFSSFRTIMVEFIETFIAACHAAGVLNSELQIIENIEIWVSSMSSSSMRPFRHTATVISLTIVSSICKIAAEMTDSVAKLSRQKESEQKKKKANESRLKEIQKMIAELDMKIGQDKEMLQGMFDTVFVHRYRDVDPKIRLECISALGNWILAFPDMFFESIHLRYLGWVLSDTAVPTRAETVKQLLKLYKNKNNVARLRVFTERFRTRVLEMAMQDADLGIRISAIELLDLIRETELLEPDDIDSIGRLIFDSEPRIRKAVAGFFAENINDLYESTLDEFGGHEGLSEILGEEVENDFDSPRPTWLKLKCTAETLHSYDSQDEDVTRTRQDVEGNQTAADSRLGLAAQNVYEVMPEAREWEVLAGYLLHDFSNRNRRSGASDVAFKKRCQLNEDEEIFLLELLDVTVKRRFEDAMEGESDRKGRRTAKQKEEAHKEQETMALHLAQTIPKLLKKYGNNPSTASPVLALGSAMNLEIFQELRQDSTIFASLLDDFNRQFMSHGEHEILTEASNAILHAQAYEDLNEVTEGKIQELWQETITNMRRTIAETLREGSDFRDTSLVDDVKRVAALAKVLPCVEVFQQERVTKKKGGQRIGETGKPLDLLIQLLREPIFDQEGGREATEVLINAAQAVRCYYMWLTVSVEEQQEAKNPMLEIPDFTPYVNSLSTLASTWPSTSQVCQMASNCVLDVHTLFARFRKSPSGNNVTVVPTVPHDSTTTILQTFTALEKQYARLSRKKLETSSTNVDDPPHSDDEDENAPPKSDDSEDDEEEQGAEEDGNENEDLNLTGTSTEQRKMRVLLSEQSLCRFTYSIVLAVVSHAFDKSDTAKVRARVETNKARLGGSFKETLALLEERKDKKAGGKKAKLTNPAADGAAAASASPAPAGPTKTPTPTPKPAAASSSKASAKKSAAVVEEDDEEEDEEEEEDEAEEGGEEDLKARELVDDNIVDADDDEQDEDDAGPPGGGADDDEEDEIMGD